MHSCCRNQNFNGKLEKKFTGKNNKTKKMKPTKLCKLSQGKKERGVPIVFTKQISDTTKINLKQKQLKLTKLKESTC